MNLIYWQQSESRTSVQRMDLSFYVCSICVGRFSELFPLYRCAGAGNLRDDILYYIKELEKLSVGDDDHRAYLMDGGLKAFRLD